MAALYEGLSKNGVDVGKLKQNINSTCSRIMQLFGPMMEHQFYSLNGNQSVKGVPFHILGFDLMFDDHLNPYILEVNYSPSLNVLF